MSVRVKDYVPVGNNSSVTIEGAADKIKVGEFLCDSKGMNHKILSVAMIHYTNPEDIGKSTTLLVEGMWQG